MDYIALGDTDGSINKASAPIQYPQPEVKTSGGEGESLKYGHNDNFAFTQTIGDIPFMRPNVRLSHQNADLNHHVNKSSETNPLVKALLRTVCCVTGIGCCYLLAKQVLVKEGQYGIAMNNGKPEILAPGRHLLSSPFNSIVKIVNSSDDVILVSPISIIRIPEGFIGLAFNNAAPEVLLPGLHVRKSAGFKFVSTNSLQDELIMSGPIKFLTVRSGNVRVCYNRGKVVIFKEGRYAINSGTFVIGGIIVTQQQNVRFDRHPVLLDGGISMLVEGLLTYKVEDVTKLITELGDRDLLHSIKDVTKAELARVFASIHLEHLATAQSNNQNNQSVLGAKEVQRGEGAETTRTQICEDVVKAISPFVAHWGIQIINFQLESTKIADEKYSKEYEEASLALAKAKANRRAVDLQNQICIEQARAQNEIVLQKSKTAAQSVTIEAEGKKTARVIAAQGEAEAREIEAKARNTSAEMMTNEFAKTYALSGLQVDFAKSLKATSLTVLPDSAVGKPIVAGLSR